MLVREAKTNVSPAWEWKQLQNLTHAVQTRIEKLVRRTCAVVYLYSARSYRSLKRSSRRIDVCAKVVQLVKT